jgi:hypothetical protein
LYNEFYKLEEDAKYQKEISKPKAPVRKIDPNNVESMNRLLKLSAPSKPKFTDTKKLSVSNHFKSNRNYISTGPRHQSVGRNKSSNVT